MEKFFEIFKKSHKTERLELCILEPTMENAEMVWDVVKTQNPDDFKYVWFTATHNSHMTESLEETLQRIKLDYESKTGCAYYVFHQGKFIGYQRIHYIESSRTLQCAAVWFVKSAWGNGFNQEVHKKLESMAFDELGANRICRQIMPANIRSKKSIESGGYHLDGIDRQAEMQPDGTFTDRCLYSKLISEYKQK